MREPIEVALSLAVLLPIAIVPPVAGFLGVRLAALFLDEENAAG